jgi:DNA modification methylase
MNIEMRPLDTIRPYSNNPRRNDGAVEAVARSLREFGFRQPVVVDTDGVIVVGHTRWRAAQQLGLTHLPVHVASDLTPVQARAYRLADNQTAAIAEWDMTLLPGELLELKDLDVDLSLLGWTPEELNELLAPKGTEGDTPADDVPEPPPVAESRPGDLWLLGEHRLLCGDSTKPAHVDRLMNGAKAALVATDPPYLVDYTGERPNESGKDWSATYKEVEITDADAFFRGLFSNVLRVVAPKAAIYCWHAHKRQALISRVWEELGILDHQQIVWVKPTPVFGRVYWHFRHEPCMMGWIQGSQPEHDADHSFNSVWEIDWEGKSRIVGNEHPTQKPVEIFARPIRKHTRPGDVCFEPFSGSGSQLIAAEQLGRRCYAMELEPVFVDVAVKRWEAFTGKQATLQRGDDVASPTRSKPVKGSKASKASTTAASN